MAATRYRMLLVGLALVVTAAACSSTKSTTNPTTTAPAGPTTTASTTSTTTPGPSDQALQAKANAALPQPSDFTSAFKQQPDGSGACPSSANQCSSLNLETVWSNLLSCLGVSDMPAATATSPTYLEGLATQARMTVEYTTQSASTAIQAAIAGPKFNSCMTSAFTTDAKASAPQGATPSAVSVSALTAPAVGDKASATRINVSMNLGGGLVIKLFQDFIVVFKGNAIARFFFLNPGGPFAPDLEQSLLTKVVNAS